MLKMKTYSALAGFFVILRGTDTDRESRFLQPPAHAGSSLADFSSLKMEVIRSSETSVHTRSTQSHFPEDGILHSHRCENLKYYMNLLVSQQLNDFKILGEYSVLDR
jgi:hypothetical protein